MLTRETATRLTAAAEHGFTLMEALVAMVAGAVVISALLTILEFSLAQNTRINDRVVADQIGRGAMTKILDELHSSCTGYAIQGIGGPAEAPGAPLAYSGLTNLWFVSAYGSKTSGNAVIEHVIEHDINWTKTATSKTGQQLGTLTDHQFASTSGNSIDGWKFPALSPANASAIVLAKNVIAPQVSGSATIFQYYKYESTAGSEDFGELVPVKSSELPGAQTTAAEAQLHAENIAKVEVAFTQAAEASDTRSDTTTYVSDAVLLRFEPSETTAESKNTACS